MNVTEFDLSNANVIKSFKLDDQAQKLVSSGKYLYAACKGEAGKSKVYVIDMSTSLFVDTVEVAKQNPVDMVVDTDRKVWVYYNDAEQAIVKLNREFITKVLDEGDDTERDTTYISNEPVTFELGTKQADYANPLCISRDGRTLYYVYGKLCANSVFIDKENDLSKESIVSGTYENEAFNGIDLDTKTNRLMGLTTSKQLVVLKSADDVWTDEAVYQVGENPIMTTFNY
jgi:sugar lactone lactonase YvrE